MRIEFARILLIAIVCVPAMERPAQAKDRSCVFFDPYQSSGRGSAVSRLSVKITDSGPARDALGQGVVLFFNRHSTEIAPGIKFKSGESLDGSTASVNGQVAKCTGTLSEDMKSFNIECPDKSPFSCPEGGALDHFRKK